MNKSILTFAFIYNLLNILFISHMLSLNEEGYFIYGIILPIFWFIAFIIYYEICSKEMKWLKRNVIPAAFFTCISVPIIPIVLIELFN